MARLRSLAIGLLLFPALNATEELMTFDSCYQKNSQSLYTLSDTVSCVATGDFSMVCHDPVDNFSSIDLEVLPLLNYNPLLRLIQIKSETKRSPVRMSSFFTQPIGHEVAAVRKEEYAIESIADYGNGLDRLPELLKGDSKGTVIGVKCYRAVAMGSRGKHVIPMEFIKAFTEGKLDDIGDIGVRLREERGKIYVAFRDLFFPKNPFELDDEIVSIDKIAVKELGKTAWQIMQFRPGSRHDVKVVRNNKTLYLNVTADRRYGGGFMPDTFLERFGVYFDGEMRITGIKADSIVGRMGLKEGDRLIRFDKKYIKAYSQIRQTISEKHIPLSRLLFERDDFQFFITLE